MVCHGIGWLVRDRIVGTGLDITVFRSYRTVGVAVVGLINSVCGRVEPLR